MMIEKSMDCFEAGIRTLMEMNHVRITEYIDALSLRCFSFRREGNVRDWFQPTISCEAAVKRLEKVTGLEGYWTVRRYQKGQYPPDTICMIGPVKEHVFLPDLKNFYYDGRTGYFCCKRNDKNTFWICDFSGVPAVQIDQSELNRMLEENLPFLVWMKPWEEKEPPKYRLDYRQLLKEGLMFHKACTLKEHNKVPECEKLGSQYMSLRYALINYGIQMRKMVAFVEAAIGLEEPVKEMTDDLWAQLVRIGLNADTDAIPDWEHRIWSVIFDHADNKGIIL